jgi:hypothetical protein
MSDLTNPRVIKLKGVLFLLMGLVAAGLLLFDAFSWRNLFLLCIMVWSFCRFYYFAFYVIEKYVDPGYKFAGLWAFAQYMAGKRKKPDCK